MKMSKKTFERLSQQLIKELQNHVNREEIVALATEQLIDDSNVVAE